MDDDKPIRTDEEIHEILKKADVIEPEGDKPVSAFTGETPLQDAAGTALLEDEEPITNRDIDGSPIVPEESGDPRLIRS